MEKNFYSSLDDVNNDDFVYINPAAGIRSMAESLLKEIPMANLGETLFGKIQGECYQPMTAEDLMALVRQEFSWDISDSFSVAFYSSLLRYLMSYREIAHPEIPIYKGLVLLEDGIFNVKKQRFIEGKKTRIFVHQVNATLGEAPGKTPHFSRFLDDISGGDAEIKRLLLAMIGYLLLPELDGKVFFVLGTAPNSGKSVLGAFLRRLIGEKNSAAIPLNELGGQFSKSSLIGAKVNICMDLDMHTLSAKAVREVKMLTGSDTLFFDIKHQTPISHRPIVKLLFGTNFPLRLKQHDSAFWDRMILIPCMHSIPREKQDKNLLKHLWKERNGIVAQALAEAQKLIENNYIFPPCKAAEVLKMSWSADKDSLVDAFIQKHCKIGPGVGKTTSKKLFAAFQVFCHGSGRDAGKVNGFSRSLHRYSELQPWSNGKKRGYSGIVLKQPNE